MEDSKIEGVKVTRRSYNGTGFAFYFAVCETPEALQAYAKSLPGIGYRDWFDTTDDQEGEPVPEAYTYTHVEDVIPGLYPDAAGDFLCSTHIMVLGLSEGRGRDAVLRALHHEIGHAVVFTLAWVTSALKAAGEEEVYMSDERVLEYPGYCNEFLCAVADRIASGDYVTRVTSGFGSLFEKNERKERMDNDTMADIKATRVGREELV